MAREVCAIALDLSRRVGNPRAVSRDFHWPASFFAFLKLSKAANTRHLQGQEGEWLASSQGVIGMSQRASGRYEEASASPRIAGGNVIAFTPEYMQRMRESNAAES